jgi:tRNA A-37 threonylcarbamoyl transferase component Bud32
MCFEPRPNSSLGVPSMPLDLSRDTLVIHPHFAEIMATHGLPRVVDFVDLEGPIVSGHPDRHVRRVTIGDETYFLKREHRVPFRERLSNWLDGFGFVSVSVREARVLDELAAAGIDAPPWVACGETADGRAFLLLKDIGPKPDLREHLRRCPDRRSRRRLARRLAALVARIHNLGFSYPDLYAKHILVDREGERFTFLDWQRSRKRHLTWRDRCRDLAALDASLSDELADADDRLTFLLTYMKAARGEKFSFRQVCALIRRRTQRLLRRSSIREQRLPTRKNSQPLHWLDGERLCLSEEGRTVLDPEEVRRVAYTNGAGSRPLKTSEVTVRRTVRRIGRLWDALRGKRWQAPECRRAAQLLREERLGGPRRLLAFGQWERAWGRVDSFLIQIAEPDAC